MLDVVWAFPNLATLELMGCEFKYARLSTWVEGPEDLPAICKYLRACQKLTELTLGLKDSPAPPSFTGAVFGNAVTELYVKLGRLYCVGFSRFLGSNSFPCLRSIAIQVESLEGANVPVPGEPYLHTIAATRTVPDILKKIVIYRGDHHCEVDTECCQVVVGTSEEVAGSPQRLSALLSGLEELTIRFTRDRKSKDPSPCAAYIHSVLPSMRKVLRFEHREAHSGGPWKEYTLPLTQ
ncbi:uncharacterized protein TRAVEDRAFT_29348 [Trametes versicolor FP-101664 SS1]|uniref:uncharacterized protein n=1 Tax=Trametes versicolor (strain FP-101664) TaxID=717944 RepID=UPI0004621DEE|nr:uncharacterized protein TRAVEDRAFT_29348 [Trametes versicolor FP-101664 SS1]EIW57134.1 hypothetical protein TRAVEDRAFT_29348 [Trametes versicolor FP-101664 SS1]